VFCVLWLLTAVITRYSSLSALLASLVTPILLWWLSHSALAALFTVLTVLLFYMHRENIKRLRAGTEGKIGQKQHRYDFSARSKNRAAESALASSP
jgi:acyl phosphate:glycerol-3-phosphate acyltransferase